MKYGHVMLDLETLAVTPDAVIVSIGAVKFNLDGDIDPDYFYRVCDLDSQKDRVIQHDTLSWWMGQETAAKEVFRDPGKVQLFAALVDLVEWNDWETPLLWSNGADFDIPIINHALDKHSIKPMVPHWNHRCFRTLKNMYKHVPKPEFIGNRHNAFADAIHQAQHVQAIHTWIGTNDLTSIK